MIDPSTMTADIAGSASLYGLKMDDFKMEFMQRNGRMDIVRMHSYITEALLMRQAPSTLFQRTFLFKSTRM